jgi:hypothetical protein
LRSLVATRDPLFTSVVDMNVLRAEAEEKKYAVNLSALDTILLHILYSIAASEKSWHPSSPQQFLYPQQTNKH